MKIILITGKAASGKTSLANAICFNQEWKSIRQEEIESIFPFSRLTEKTKFLIFDEIKDLRQVARLFENPIEDKILILPLGEKSFRSIPTPTIIIIKQTKEDLRFDTFKNFYQLFKSIEVVNIQEFIIKPLENWAESLGMQLVSVDNVMPEDTDSKEINCMHQYTNVGAHNDECCVYCGKSK